jgi:hypothetical protein
MNAIKTAAVILLAVAGAASAQTQAPANDRLVHLHYVQKQKALIKLQFYISPVVFCP